MMRLPSVVHVIRVAREAAYRFPWVLLSAFVSACLCWVLAVYRNSFELEQSLSRLLLPAMLGIPVFVALALWLERSSLAARRHWIGLATGMIVLGMFWLSYRQESPQIYLYRFCQLALAAHLLVAVAPYQRGGDIVAFWQFNRILFQRILQAILFSSILYAGLAIALWAVQSLLGLKVGWKAYYFLFLAVTYLFNTWFFLAGIPSKELERDEIYPAGFRMFVQFMLLPLVTLYVLILYSYLVKILLTREWPRGTIGWLVSIVAVFGMLALLLVHPLRSHPGHRWIQLYSRLFYAGLFPLIVLLLMAIWRRVSEYGLTEDRYFLTTLTLWMTGIAAYFSFSRQPSIKVIPVSLALVGLLTIAGPWGPYACSRRDQLNRLRLRLERLGILKDGRIERRSEPVEFNDRKEISALVRYLVDMHGDSSLQPWFAEDLKPRLEKAGEGKGSHLLSRHTYGRVKAITELMGVPYLDVWQHIADSKHFYANTTPLWNEVRSIAGYDYLSRFNLYRTNGGTASSVITIGSSRYELFWGPDVRFVELREGKDTLVKLDMGPFLERLRQQTAEGSNTGLSEETMSLEGESTSARIKLRFENLSGTRDSSNIRLNNAHGEVLLKLKGGEAGR
jgi:hypothetical protein